MSPLALSPDAARIRFHLRFGWWSLIFFVSLGLALEAMHGFKVGWYLDAMNETRRLMFTLAHAHGALLALTHVAFAGTVWLVGPSRREAVAFASRGLSAASIFLPLGFFLGGFGVAGGDPGLGIVFVPLGAASLLFSLALLGWSLRE